MRNPSLPALFALALVLAPAAARAADAAAPATPLLTPWFHVHAHTSTCFCNSSIPFAGDLCAELRYEEQDVFLYRNGLVVEVRNERGPSVSGATVEPLHGEVRRGPVPAAKVAALRQALADSRFGAQAGNCDPFPGQPRVDAHHEVVWYTQSAFARILDLSTDFETPCSPALVDILRQLLDLASTLPPR